MKNKSLSKRFFYNGIIVTGIGLFVVVSVALLVLFWAYKKEVSSVRKSYFVNQERIVKYMVESSIDEIRFKLKNSPFPKAKTRDIIIKSISKIRFPIDGQEPGILFIRDFEGIQIVSSSRPELVGKNVSSQIENDGINTHELFLTKIENDGEGFVDYSWYNHITKKIQKKRSFIKPVPELNWIIGAGFWYEDLDKIIENKKLGIQKVLIQFLFIIIIISIVLFFVIFIIAKKLTGKMNADIQEFSKFLTHFFTHDKFIQFENIKYDEFKLLAISANKMILAQKEAKLEVDNKNKKWQALMNQAGDAIYLSDFDGNILDANFEATRESGYIYEELLEMKVGDLDVVHPNLVDQRKFWTSIKEGIPKTLLSSHRRKDGSVFPVEINVGKITIDGQVMILGIVRNITERKKIEAENNKVKNNLLRAEKIAHIGYWEFNLESKIMVASEGSYEIYGVDSSEGAKTLSFAQSIPLEKYRPILNTAIYDLVKYNKPYDVEFEIKRKNDGQIRIIRSLAEYDKDQNIVFGVLRDITKTKLIEKKLKEQIEEYSSLNEEYKSQNEELFKAKEIAIESNRLKSTFLQNMSHEIRTPMNGIMGFSQMLNSSELRLDRVKYYTGIILSSAQQLLRVIDDILEISQLETKQLKAVLVETHLNKLLRQQYEIFELKTKDKRLSFSLEMELSDEECLIMTDEMKLIKIVSNLLENAIKFTEKGEVSFGYKRIEESGKHFIRFFVRDTGIGINKEKQNIIFDRFSQADSLTSQKFGGLGLGLSIARENSHLLGGKIWVESEKEKGTCFYFTIPYKISN